MNRILIIGSGGAGKSTLARRIGEVTGLPVIHLDQLHWKPNWTGTPKEEWKQTVAEVLKGESWVMDGNFGGTMEMRLEACDTVVYLDFPRLLCLYRALKRIITYYNKTRPDMAEGCHEKLDLEFLGWVWNFPKTTKPVIEGRLKRFETQKRIIRLRSPREVDEFLAGLRRG